MNEPREKSLQVSTFDSEVARGERFRFGANWQRFLTTLDEERIAIAEESLRDRLEVPDLKGKRFLDIGSGSGLFSLAARRLGAQVVSFDFDPQSVATTAELKRRYFPADPDWQVFEGSVLDRPFLETLGTFDVVYSWGVLHHTGQMWEAIGNAVERVDAGGTLFIAIYNDQGLASQLWRTTKKIYNRLPGPLRFLVLVPAFIRLWGPTTVKDLLRGKPGESWRTYRSQRGMSAWHDVVDWVGGYPFEVASVAAMTAFLRSHGFEPMQIRDCGRGHGCNEFVLRRKGTQIS